MYSAFPFQIFIVKIYAQVPTSARKYRGNRSNMASMGTTMMVEQSRQLYQETATERGFREAANFHGVENKLMERWSTSEIGLIDKMTGGLLGINNPFAKKADPEENRVWLLDNTAYRPVHPYPHEPQPWQAEFVACFFRNDRKDIAKFVSNIAEQIGLDDTDGEARQRIAEREWHPSANSPEEAVVSSYA